MHPVFSRRVRPALRAVRAARFMPLGLAMRAYGGTDKLGHGYHHFYSKLLRHLRPRRFTLLEIGVLRGESLRVWRDMFPLATIVGVDIDPPKINLGPRVRIAYADQSSAGDLEAALEGLRFPRVVIDDGSHRGPDIWASFHHLFPRLPRHGMYFVEDLATSYWPTFGGGIPASAESGVGLAHQLLEDVQTRSPVYGAYDWNPPQPPSVFSEVASLVVAPNIFAVRHA